MAVLALLARPGLPAPGSPLGAAGDAEVRVLGAAPERLEAVVRSDQPTVATAAIAWSPKWHVTVDGRPLRPGRSRDGLLTVPLPAGSSRVVLRFRSDGWDHAGAAGTLLTLFALAAWAAWRRRPRRPAQVATPAEGADGRQT
jgi:Bacterial membrane protein YfhO